MQMELETLKVDISGAIATVTLHRPDCRNAFNEQMIVELTGFFLHVDERDEIRAVVLTASGSAFCAGADLTWMQRMARFSEAENHADARNLAAMLAAVHHCRKPVLARIQGDVYAGGLGLVAASDIAVAVNSARFCLSEARLGLIPATIAPYLIGAIGARAASRYFMTAEVFDCSTARRLGLVHEMVAPADLDTMTESLTQALCANGPEAVRESKRLVHELTGRPIDTSLLEESAARIARVRAGREAQEGIAAFLEKRRPAWR
jgi:methylglutaconyl-CoA hydratase